jgi:hypothetical protein
MAAPLLEFEGLWDEIAVQLPDLAGRRVRLTVVPLDEASSEEIVSSPEDPRLALLREIDTRSRSMNPRPDERDYLREGRAGATP